MGDALSHTKPSGWWYTDLSEFYKLDDDESVVKKYKPQHQIIEQEIGNSNLESTDDPIINRLFEMSFNQLELILFYRKISNEFPIIPYSELKYKTSIVYRYRRSRVDFFSDEMYTNFNFINRVTKTKKKAFKKYIKKEIPHRLGWFLKTDRLSVSLFKNFESYDLSREMIIKIVNKEIKKRQKHGK